MQRSLKSFCRRRRRRRIGKEARQIAGVGGIGRAEERVSERDGIDVAQLGILAEGRIDEEHHRHIDLLMRLEPLLGEAEALNLVEIDAGLQRRHIERRMPDDRLIAGVLGGEIDKLLLAEMHLHRALLRREAPRQARLDIAVELHRHHPLGDGGGVLIDALRGAAEPGRAAKQAIQLGE